MSFPSARMASKAMTISATGKRSSGGFTILEILLVLFLIAMVGTIFVVNIDSLLRDQEEATVEKAFWNASREARLQALFKRSPVSLAYDAENDVFNLAHSGAVIDSFPAAGVTRTGEEITVEFVQQRASTEMVLLRGELVDTRPIDQVVFYPDGSCTSFWVQLNYGSDSRQIRIDPWTGAEMLPQEEE